MLTPGYLWVPSINLSKFGPAGWAAIANMQIDERRALLCRDRQT